MSKSQLYNISDIYKRVGWQFSSLRNTIRYNYLPFPDLVGGKKEPNQFSIGNSNTTPILNTPLLGEVELGGIKFAIPPTITLSKEIDVTESRIAGTDGTVKEVIGGKDWKVNLKCLLTENEIQFVDSQNGSFKIVGIHDNAAPLDLLRQMDSLVNSKKSQKVISPFLNLMGIEYLFVNSISFPDLDGYDSMIPCELACSSDKPLQVNLNIP